MQLEIVTISETRIHTYVPVLYIYSIYIYIILYYSALIHLNVLKVD